MRTSLEVAANGRIIWVKGSESSADAIRLRREAQVLRGLRHPNVTELVDTAEGRLSFAFVGRSTLAAAPPTSDRHIADTIRALSTVLDELHVAGVAHGGISPDHCLLAPDGRIVLASWGRAIPIDGPHHPAARADRLALAAMIEVWFERGPTKPSGRDRRARRETADLLRNLSRRHAPTIARPDDPTSPATAPAGSVRAHVETGPEPLRHAHRRRRELRGAIARLVTIAAITCLLWTVDPVPASGGIRHDGMSAAAADALAAVQWAARFASLYGVLVSAVCAVAVVTGSARSRAWGGRLGPAWVQRLVAGIALAGLGATVARSAIPDPTPAATIEVNAPVVTVPNVDRPAPPPAMPSTPTRSPIFRRNLVAPATGVTPMPPPLPATDPVPAHVGEPAGLTWMVRPGDHFWRIAEQTLTLAWGRTPTDREVDPYWRALIALNRHHLVDPPNADLIYVGQVIALPPVPLPGSRAA